MSVYSERVRKALYAKLNVSGVLSSGTGLATAVYEGKAPKGAALPYLIFHRQADEPVTYSMGQTNILETSFWVVQGFADTPTTTKSPQEVAETIAQNAETALGTSLTLTGGGTVGWLGRVNNTPALESQQGDRYVYQRGFLVRVSVE
jgi:hypothetical protein